MALVGCVLLLTYFRSLLRPFRVKLKALRAPIMCGCTARVILPIFTSNVDFTGLDPWWGMSLLRKLLYTLVETFGDNRSAVPVQLDLIEIASRQAQQRVFLSA